MEKINRIVPNAIRSGVSETTVDILKNFLEAHYHKCKEDVDFYMYLKGKIEELETRLDSNLHFKLTLLNSKYSGKIINARIKLPFATGHNKKSKYNFFNIHVGKLSNYKLGLEDPQVKVDALRKIKEFIDEKYPFRLEIIDNQDVALKCLGEEKVLFKK